MTDPLENVPAIAHVLLMGIVDKVMANFLEAAREFPDYSTEEAAVVREQLLGAIMRLEEYLDIFKQCPFCRGHCEKFWEYRARLLQHGEQFRALLALLPPAPASN